MYGNYPCKFYGKTERTPAGTAAVQEKAADLERQAVEAIGKNFVKASAESVNEALEKWGRLLKRRMPRRLPEDSLPGKESVRMRRSFPGKRSVMVKRRDRGQSAETAGREYAQGMGDS